MDGLIVSTPTGSTGWNLSAGGPVLYELMPAVVATPVMPLRRIPPVVVPVTNHFDIRVAVSDEASIISDGSLHMEVNEIGREIIIRPSDKTFKVVRLTTTIFQHLKKTIAR